VFAEIAVAFATAGQAIRHDHVRRDDGRSERAVQLFEGADLLLV
jgi:uncharacterized protein (DUF849 family)